MADGLREQLERIALARLSDARTARPTNPTLSRRSVLLGAGASIGSVLAPRLTLADSRAKPQARFKRGQFSLEYAGLLWSIDSAAWEGRIRYSGPNGELQYDRRYELDLRSARFPGTRIKAGFSSEIRFERGDWVISIHHDLAADPVTMPLFDWMQGAELVATPKRRKARFVVGKGARLAASDAERLHISSDLSVALDAKIAHQDRASPFLRFHGLGLRVFRTPADAPDVPEFEVPPEWAVTQVQIFDVGFVPLSETKGSRNYTLSLRSDASRIEAAFFASGWGRDAEAFTGILALNAELNIDGPVIASQGGVRIPCADVSLSGRSDDLAEVALVYRPADSEFGVSLDALSASLHFRRDNSDQVEILSLTLSNEAMSHWEFPVALSRLSAPVEGASAASFQFHETEIDVLVGQESPSDSMSAATLRLGQQASLRADLNDQDELHLVRSADLFDLKFSFVGYRLEFAPTASGDKYALPRTLLYPSIPNSRLIAHFPPQHLAEEAWEQDGLAVCSPTEKRGIASHSIAALAQNLASGPTRLVFKGMEPPADGTASRELTIERITDWGELCLEVHKRALPRDATLKEQLRAAGIEDLGSGLDRAEAARIIRESVDPEYGGAPSPLETAIEAVTGIIVSPSEYGKFDTPRSQPDPSTARHWTANLRLPRSAAVRAISATDFDLSFFSENDSENQIRLTPFVTSVNAQDRRELVVMSSVYGLPALRRLVAESSGSNTRQRPPCSAFFDDPAGMVFRPEPSEHGFPDYLSEDPAGPACDGDPGALVYAEGLIVPRPFGRFELSLSSQRASLNARWSGEPPAPFVARDKTPRRLFREALGLEKFEHRTSYGRDVFVQVSYKGFLFPIGHRATLLRLTERRFLPYRNNRRRRFPTAYLVQEEFIVVRKPVKTFPALNQPNQGRGFPAAKIEVLTTVTPPIVLEPVLDRRDPARRDQGEQEDCDFGPDKAVWPRTSPGEGNEFLFEYRVDDAAVPAKSPLIFVSNAAAHDPKLMKCLTDSYNTLSATANLTFAPERPGQNLCLAQHDLSPRAYAPAGRDGETSFQTDNWALGSTGRAGAEGQLAFEMDAFMEGEDQPPFYPVLAEARVNVQSAERLLGRELGLIRVGVNDLYLESGFDESRNPSELFLSVRGPEVRLDFTKQGNSSGGIAKPNATLAALSRKIGLVGGRLNRQARDVNPGIASTSVTRTDLSLDISSVEQGLFDPFEFLPDAKLLGIIDLKDVLRAVAIAAGPQLKEAYQFGSSDLQAQFEKLQRTLGGFRGNPGLADTAAQAIDGLLSIADSNLELMNPSWSLRDLYPVFVDRTRLLRERLEALGVAAREREPVGPFFARATAVHQGAKDLLGRVEELIENPIPAVAYELLEKAKTWQEEIEKVLDGVDVDALYGTLTTEFCTRVISDNANTFLGVFGETSDRNGEQALAFFPNPVEKDPVTPDDISVFCEKLVRNPGVALEQTSEALFFDTFSRDLRDLLLALSRMDIDSIQRHLVDLAGKQFERLIYDLLHLGVTPVNGFREPGLYSLAAKLAEVIANALAPTGQELADALREREIGPLLSSYAMEGPRVAAAKEAVRVVLERELETTRSQLNNSREANKAALARASGQVETLIKQAEEARDATGLAEIEDDIAEARAKVARIEAMRTALRELDMAYRSQASVDDILDLIWARLGPELRGPLANVAERVESLADNTQDSVAGRAAGLMSNMLNYTASATRFSALAALRNEVDGWCAAAGVADSLDTLCFRLTAPVGELSAKLQRLLDLIDRIPSGRQLGPDLQGRLSSIKSELTSSASRLVDHIQAFERYRAQGIQATVCTANNDWLNRISRSLALRLRAIEALGRLISQWERLADLVRGGLPGIASTPIDELRESLEELVYLVSGADAIRTQSRNWVRTRDQLTRVFSQAPLSGMESLRDAVFDLVSQYDSIVDRLDVVIQEEKWTELSEWPAGSRVRQNGVLLQC